MKHLASCNTESKDLELRLKYRVVEFFSKLVRKGKPWRIGGQKHNTLNLVQLSEDNNRINAGHSVNDLLKRQLAGPAKQDSQHSAAGLQVHPAQLETFAKKPNGGRDHSWPCI